MNEFDFLARMPLGQYVAMDSPIHRLDPRTKVFIFTLLFLAITFGRNVIGLSIGLVFLLCLTLASRINLKFALKGLLAPLPFLVLFAVIQILLYSTSKSPDILFSFWIIHITVKGLLTAAILLIRFIGLILAFSLASFCISSSELIQGTQHLLSPFNKIGLKTIDMVMVMQITLRFIPLLAQTAERIAKNQASRGADWGAKKQGLISRIRSIFPLIVPLFVISLRRAMNLALAMDARAYGCLDYRTSMYELHFQKRDAWAILLTLCISFLIIFW